MKRVIVVGLLVLMSALAPFPVSSRLEAAPAPTPTPQCQPDFTLSASPTSATLPRANNVHFQLTATSVCGASGYIYFQSPSVTPQTNGIYWNYLCYCNPPLVGFSPTAPAQITLAIIADKGTPDKTYTITIPAAYEARVCLTCPAITTHSVAVTVTVTDPVPPYP
jgi:hypothetical protein